MAAKTKSTAVARKKTGYKGGRTRASLLRAPVDLASLGRLEGLSIGRLANELEMGKSGRFAHFGPKQDLQLATVEMASEIFTDKVVLPALAAPERNAPVFWLRVRSGLVMLKIRCSLGVLPYRSFIRVRQPNPVRSAIVKAMSM